MSENIGIFGGSFNPPHVGHADICRHLLGNNIVDEIWIVPCFQHPFNKPLAPFDDRLTMCRFAFQEFKRRASVSDVERRLGGVSHTVRTIRHFRKQYPRNNFSLIIGADISDEKEDWKDFREIKEMADLIELPRGKDSFITDISSSEIRKKIKNGEEYSKFIANPVAVYIVTHGLYHD